MGGGFPQFCMPPTAFALRQAEPALNFHTLAFISVILRLVSGFSLPGPSQRRAGEPNVMLLAITEVFPVPVDLVRQDTAGIMPLPLAEPFCHLQQVPSFIVGVKGAKLQPRPPIHNADIQFCTELHRFSHAQLDAQRAGLR